MQSTAEFATGLLQWSGVPVMRSYMYINIPGGYFQVARACSGLNYFVTSVVLGVLYGYLNYRGWLKRAVCVLAFVVIPIVLNGLRVYFTILVSHLTDMRFGPGTEHRTFGLIFFVVMMLAFFWIGRRWHDEPVEPKVVPARDTSVASGGMARWWPVPLAWLLIVGAPAYLASSVTQARTNLAADAELLSLPEPAPGWTGPVDGKGRWRPLYHGGLVERQAVYRDLKDKPVDVFVAVYGIGNSAGTEMISYNNIVSVEEYVNLSKDARRRITLPDGSSLVVRELVAADAGNPDRVVWHWFVIGDRSVASEYQAKALEALAFVTRGAHSERFVAVSTPLDDAAPQRLEAFLVAHGRCAATGFRSESCQR